MTLSLWKFLIDEETFIVEELEEQGSFVWQGYCAVALASSETEARELLIEKLQAFGVLTGWLRFAEVIEIKIVGPAFVSFSQVD